MSNNRNRSTKNFNNRGYNDNNSTSKKSGSKHGKTKKGAHYVTAWNVSKSKGFLTVKAFENKKSVYSESENGNKFIMMMFEIFYKDTGNTVLQLANFNLTTGKVYLDKLNMVISTKAPNGGYFGQA